MKIYQPQISGSLAINGTSITNFNDVVTTSSFQSYTSSIQSRVNTIESFTASNSNTSLNNLTGSLSTTGSNIFFGNQQISGTVYLTGSIIPSVTNIYDLGDSAHQFRHLYLSSGSLYINGTKVLGATGQELQITTDAGQSLKILEAGSDTITLQSADGNITLASSGNGDVILDPTSGIIALKGTTTLYSGNKLLSSDGNAIQIGNDISVTGSLTTTTGNVNGVNISSLSSSVASAIPNLNNATSSIQTFTSSINTRVTNLENADLTFATTGSNTFKGNQIISASVYVTGDLVVYGSSSVQNISASIVSIGTNIVNLNTSTPSVRFGGIAVIDSGSNGLTGSLLWDSQNNRWVYSNPSGAAYDGGMLISGPRNTSGLGNEIGMTSARLVVGMGGDHISSSAIYHDDTTTSFPNNVEISGSATITTLNAGNGIVSGSTQIKNLLPNGTVSGSSQVTDILVSLNNFSSSNALTSLNSYTSSATNRFTRIEESTSSLNSYTSSATIRLNNIETTTSSLSTTYEGRASASKTLFSGSSQVTMASTTGFGTYINQAVLTTSSPTFAGMTMNGSIGKTHDLMSEGTFGYSATYKTLKLGSTSASNPQSIAFGVDLSGNAGSSFSGYGTEYFFRNVGSFKTPNSANNEYNTLLSWNNIGGITFGGSEITSSGDITITNCVDDGLRLEGSAPTICFKDTDQYTGYIHINSNWFYVLTGPNGAGDGGWSQVANSRWPFRVNLTNNNAEFGGDVNMITLTTTGNASVGGTLTESSSLRYKENVETIKYGLDKVLQMRGVTYDKKNTGVKEVGVIAEEVYDILPEVVLKNEEGEIDSVSYGRMVGVLIEAIKEQQKQIEELKSLIK